MTISHKLPIALAMALLPIVIIAGWEDIDVSNKPRGRASAAAPAPVYRAAPAPAYRQAPPQRQVAPAPVYRPAPQTPVYRPAPVQRQTPPPAQYYLGGYSSSTDLLPPDLYSAYLDANRETEKW